MPDATNKWFTSDDSDGVTPTGEIFRGPATEDEKKKINLVVKASSQEISGLKYPTEDVIGEWRVLRFVRSHLGDTEKAKKHFKVGSFSDSQPQYMLYMLRLGDVYKYIEQFRIPNFNRRTFVTEKRITILLKS